MSVSPPAILKILLLLIIINLEPTNALIIKKSRKHQNQLPKLQVTKAAHHKKIHERQLGIKDWYKNRKNKKNGDESYEEQSDDRQNKPGKNKNKSGENRDYPVQECNHQSGDIITLGLVALLLYMIFNNASGLGLIFTLPIFLTIITRLFNPGRVLHLKNNNVHLNSRCRSLRVLRKTFDQKFFNERKLSVVRYLKDHNISKKIELTQKGLFELSKNYFQEEGNFNNDKWMGKLQKVTDRIWSQQKLINTVMGLMS